MELFCKLLGENKNIMRNKKIIKWIAICVILLISIILMPLLAVRKCVYEIRENDCKKLKLCKEDMGKRCFHVLDESSGKVIDIPDREFVYGVVTAEMPAKFEDEAIKAQAVASYTYFCRERDNQRKNSNYVGYDFKVNTEKWINYVSPEQRRIKWGEHFEEYENKIKRAVDSVFGEVVEDDGELILAAYHAISSGKTEKSADVFGGDLKYLSNVESPGDKLVSGYETFVKVDTEKFKDILNAKYSDIDFNGNEGNWVGESVRSEGGMVKEIRIGSKSIKGTEVRSMFGLRSSDFDLNFSPEENKFIFRVHGYGHGVGMSQHGAEYMAQGGSDYKKILSWYYPGTCICKLDN